MAFSPDGLTLAAGYVQLTNAAGYVQGGVELWDLTVRKRLVDEPLAVKEGDIQGMAFSPDGRTLAASYMGDVGHSGGVILWDVAAARAWSTSRSP